MRLYTQNGHWVGTQAEAKREHGEVNLVDVPTDKAALLEWLNFHAVGSSYVPPIDSDSIRTAVPTRSSSTRPHPWQSVREMAESASLKDLGVVLAVIMNRMDELADKEVTS